MKKFSFSLGKVLSFEEPTLEKEKNLLGRLNAQRLELEEKLKRLEEQIRDLQEEKNSRIQKGTTVFQLKILMGSIENGRKNQMELFRQKEQLEQQIEIQRQNVVKASQEVKKLENLKAKKLEEYHYAEAKEQQETISEHVAGEFVRHGVSI